MKKQEGWKPANDPPPSTPGKWSREVVAITDLGNVHLLTYIGTKENGVWQRPATFHKDENVAFWIEQPNLP